MKNPFTLLPACVALLAGLCAPLHAATYTDTETNVVYTYEVSGTSATLTEATIPSSVTSLTLPSTIGDYTVTELGEDLFYNTSLVSVVIPEGVTTIGPYAFYCCYSLTTVSLPSTLTTIGYLAFGSCWYLDNVELPASLTSMGDGIFYNCYRLSSIEIPSGITTIGTRSFYQCFSLSSAILPEGVTLLGEGAFYGCAKLTSIDLPSTVTSIDYAAFMNTGLQAIVLPKGLTTLGDYAFCGSAGLSSVTFLGDPPTSVGTEVFEGVASGAVGYYVGSDAWTTALVSSTTWNGLTMEELVATFTWTVNTDGTTATLTGVTIPQGITSIEVPGTVSDGTTSYAVTTLGDGLFFEVANADLVTSITLPESLTTIGAQVFAYCEALTSMAIPESVTSIGDQVFAYCYTLASVTLPSSTISLGTSLFLNCTALSSIELPSGLEEIGSSAFAYSAVTSITLPASVSSIGTQAFFQGALSSVTFLGEPPTVGDNAFSVRPETAPTGTYLGTAEWEDELATNTDTSTGLWNEISMTEVSCSLPEGLADAAAVKTRILAALEGQSSLPAIEVTGTSTTIQDCMDLGITPSVSVVDSSATVAFEAPTLEVTAFDPATKTLTFKVVPGTENTLTQLPTFSNVKLYGASSLSEAMQEVTGEVTADTAAYLTTGSEGTFTLTLSDTLPAFLQLRINE